MFLIIRQHLAQFLLAETYKVVKPRVGGDIRSDVESACHVVHRHRAYSCDEQTVDGRTHSRRGGFDYIEKPADIPFAMRRFSI